MPSSEDTRVFAERLAQALEERPGAEPTRTHVDVEGEATWLRLYATERLQGRSPRQARNTVIDAVRAGGR
jgi:hypothetical protein